MVQQAEVKSRSIYPQKQLMNQEIKVNEIIAAPDYIYMSSTEFIQHFTNMITANENIDLWEEHKNYIKVVGYCNRGLFDTILNYLSQKNKELTIATTPLHHTSWRNGQEKYVKPKNIHIIEMNDAYNGTESFPDIEKCDIVVITHMFGQDFTLKGLAEFKKRTGAIVIEDRVQAGSLDLPFSDPLIDISIMSMAMDKRPIALGGGFLHIRKKYRKMAKDIHKMITSYPVEPKRKRYIDLLKKIPTFLLYNKRVFTFILLRSLKVLNKNLLDFTNSYRKKNPGFERNNFTLMPSKGLLKSMSQHFYDHKNMEEMYARKYKLFRSYLPKKVTQQYFPWFNEKSTLTPYNTIYVDTKYVQKFLKFMNRSEVCIIWNPTYKMFNFPYENSERYQDFHDGLVYLPCLAIMTDDEIRYLADRIVRFDNIVSK